MSYPISYNLRQIKAAMSPAPRLIFGGDSFVSFFDTRMSRQALYGWPIPTITAFNNGMFRTATAGNNPIFEYTDGASAGAGALVDIETGAINGGSEYFNLPVHGLFESSFDADYSTGSSGLMLSWSTATEHRTMPITWRPAEQGVRCMCRNLYYCPATIGDLTSRDVNRRNPTATLIDTVNFSTDARRFHWKAEGDPDAAERGTPLVGHINAIYPDVLLNNETGANNLKLLVFRDTLLDGVGGAINTSDFLTLAGTVLYEVTAANAWVTGTYVQELGDNSWSYAGFGADAAASAGTAKQFSELQLRHWLDVTTLSLTQQPIFVFMLASESQASAAAVKTLADAIVTVFETSCTSIGLPKPWFLFILPFSHSGATATEHEYMSQGVYNCARNRERVAFYSMYQDTGGIELSGSATAQAWLAANQGNSFKYGNVVTPVDLVVTESGNLLDGTQLHPKNANSAAFFAAMTRNRLTTLHGWRNRRRSLRRKLEYLR